MLVPFMGFFGVSDSATFGACVVEGMDETVRLIVHAAIFLLTFVIMGIVSVSWRFIQPAVSRLIVLSQRITAISLTLMSRSTSSTESQSLLAPIPKVEINEDVCVLHCPTS